MGINHPNKVPNLWQLIIVHCQLLFLILMASSSSNSGASFKVFVSFREENVGNNFVTHLYAALVHAGIYYFDVQRREKDERNLMITVPKMIEESDLAIIIFSEDNAYSRLCLEEVVKIMECKKQRDLKVFPVFYRVELGRVSGLKGSYRTGIEYFQKKLDKDVRKLMRWKDALQEAGSLSGWYLDDEMSEAKIIEDIVKKISELKMYDVFLSFRGKDVREYFVKGLNEALVQKGIKTFMDSENLLMGQDFPSKLKEAIEQSRMYVVVFSENYAESWWCLKELVQIQGEKNRTKQLLPIFYKVAPGEVRGQNPREVSGKKQSYEKALTDHESEFGKRKVKKWKEALSKAANVNGIHLHDGNMHGCIPRIVKEIEKMMQRIE